MKPFFRSRAPNFLLAASAMLFTLIGFEAVLRFVLPQKLYRFPPGMFVNDPDAVFRLSPGFRGVLENPEYVTHFRINSLGLRGAEPAPRQPGVARILALGDSFVSAFNVEENRTFLAVAESTLRKNLGTSKILIINGGTPNYGTWHELRLFRKLSRSLSPDAAMLCVYVGNDVENNLAPRVAVVRDGLLVERQAQRGILPYALRSWLQRNSMVYVFLWNAWNDLRPRIGFTASDTLRPEKELVSPGSPYMTKGYEVTEELLRQFQEESVSRRIPLFLVLIPAEFQVYPERFERTVRKQGLDPSRLDLDLPQRRWSEILSRLSLPFVDLLPEFRSRRDGPYLYMSLDGHLSVEGNRLAGEAISRSFAPFLQKSVVGAP